MTRLPSQLGLTPSLYDRLIDPESGGTAQRSGFGLEQVVASVRRDLEALLNTRIAVGQVPAEFEETRRSIVRFGLPDFTYFDITTGAARSEVGRLIEEAIQLHEPRLKDVRAVVVDSPLRSERLTLRFQIEARLSITPFPDVSFETVLELSTGHAMVQSTS